MCRRPYMCTVCSSTVCTEPMCVQALCHFLICQLVKRHVGTCTCPSRLSGYIASLDQGLVSSLLPGYRAGQDTSFASTPSLWHHLSVLGAGSILRPLLVYKASPSLGSCFNACFRGHWYRADMGTGSVLALLSPIYSRQLHDLHLCRSSWGLF